METEDRQEAVATPASPANEASSEPLVQIPLVHCAYASVAKAGFGLEQVMPMLATIRPKNALLGISGMLLYCEGNFFQVIEGPQDVVDALFERIAADSRHHHVIKLIEEPITQRAFADWTMGCAEVSRKDLAGIDGLNDFFVGGSCFSDLGDGRARTLLAAFHGGRWRQAA